RVHHDVDGERDDPERPLLVGVELAAEEIERHREPVIDLHLVDDGEIELVEDDRLRDVRGEFGMALDHRHRARAPALVGGREFGRTAERERRDQVDRKRRGVVVIAHDRDVGFQLPQPLLRLHETREHPLPIGLLGLVVVERRADGGHVRRADAGDDLGHDVTSVWLETWFSAWTWIWSCPGVSPWSWRRAWPAPWPRRG